MLELINSKIDKAQKNLNLDYLSVSFEMKHIDNTELIKNINANAHNQNYKYIIEISNYHLCFSNKPTQRHHLHIEIYKDGEKIAYGLYMGRDGVNFVTPYSSVIKFTNEFIWSNTEEEIITEMSNKEIYGNFVNFQRIDISVDLSVDLMQDLSDVILNKNTKLKFNNKIDMRGFDNLNNRFQTIQIGQLSGKSQLVIYDKIEEISKSGKLYILEKMRSLTETTIKEMTRFETRISLEYIKDYGMQEKMEIIERKNLINIFKTILKKKFTIQTMSMDKKTIMAEENIKISIGDHSEIKRVRTSTKGGNPLRFVKTFTKKFITSVSQGYISQENKQYAVNMINQYDDYFDIKEYIDKKAKRWILPIEKGYNEAMTLIEEFTKEIKVSISKKLKSSQNGALAVLRGTQKAFENALYVEPRKIISIEDNFSLRECPF